MGVERPEADRIAAVLGRPRRHHRMLASIPATAGCRHQRHGPRWSYLRGGSRHLGTPHPTVARCLRWPVGGRHQLRATLRGPGELERGPSWFCSRIGLPVRRPQEPARALVQATAGSVDGWLTPQQTLLMDLLHELHGQHESSRYRCRSRTSPPGSAMCWRGYLCPRGPGIPHKRVVRLGAHPPRTIHSWSAWRSGQARLVECRLSGRPACRCCCVCTVDRPSLAQG